MQDSKRCKPGALLLLSLSLLSMGVSFAQSSEASMDAAGMFGKNATGDGPITICSDSLSYSQDAHKMIYQGNVLVMQTKNANIQCGGHNVPNENSKWSVYQFPLQNVDYQKLQQQSLDYAKEVCKKQNGCRFLSGQILTLLFDDQNRQLKEVTLTSTDPYMAKFYSLPFPKEAKTKQASSDQETMYAEGRQMDFNLLNSILTIQTKAHVDRAGNRFSGDKVLYDTKNGLVTVPDTGQRATVILNNLKQD